MQANSLVKSRIDRITVIIYFFLVLGGLVMIHAVGRPADGYEQDYAGMLSTPAGKQLIWVIISVAAWFFINLLVDRNIWVLGAYPIYVGTVLLLILVLLVGKEINGARSWFSIAGMTLQPSELAKFGACLAMAAYLSQWSEKLDRVGSILNGMVIWLIPAGLVILQPDPGSALVFTSFFLVMYREGMPPLLLVLGGFTMLMFILGILQPLGFLTGGLLTLLILVMSFFVPRRRKLWVTGAIATTAVAGLLAYFEVGWPVIVGLFVVFVGSAAYHFLRKNGRLVGIVTIAFIWGVAIAGLADFSFENVLKPHQQDRIDAWLRPDRLDKKGGLYNLTQAKLAIAAGGIAGKGRHGGTMTRYDYVPEQETDFIFTAIGEEEGFVGVTILITGFFLLLWRISVIAERQKRTFARAFAYGVAGVILIHLLVNIGMTMGLMPVIGIPLPFISKGGSSLLSFTLMIAVLLKLDRHREAV
ncbi:MAG: rod shape determining protein RodA [Neolewinella sp.]|jgi:rod shape determining protein RodA